MTLKKEEALADYTVRELIVECPETGSQALHVIQFHFTAWPDHGVPQYATGLLSFRNRVNKHTSLHPTTPTVVHCSAGVGRTGTYIAIDILIQKLEKEGTTDVFNVVRNLRFQRRYMVQTVVSIYFITVSDLPLMSPYFSLTSLYLHIFLSSCSFLPIA